MNKEKINQEPQEKIPQQNLENNQHSIASAYLREYEHQQKLTESYQGTLKSLDKLRDEALLYDNDSIMVKLKDELNTISRLIDGSMAYMQKLDNQLTDKSRNKYLIPDNSKTETTVQDDEVGAESINEKVNSPEANTDTADIDVIKDKIVNDVGLLDLYKYQGEQNKADLVNRQIKDRIAKLNHLQTGSEDYLSKDEEIVILNEISTENTIKNAEDIGDLCKKIAHNKISLTGSDGYIYSSEQLIDLVHEVASGQKTLNYLTSTMGLRKKVQEILETEAIKKG